ncbi:unnamed protein product [Coffea canephora]|uniref:Uncharacterized protein n=1 Tax=Coffea canephora TaxID=49390 RepID=A0A068V6M4_COFCA|nr:unnamed protein product [Coffea canephora]
MCESLKMIILHNDYFSTLCSLGKLCFDHPFLLANILFFLNVNVLFWLFGLFPILSSEFMLDMHWSGIPVLSVRCKTTHPLTDDYEFNIWRSRIVILLTWVWSNSFSDSYLCHENWQLGLREDRRFNQLQRAQFWFKYIVSITSNNSHVVAIIFLTSSVRSFWCAVKSKREQLNICDSAAIAVCLAGEIFAYHANKQLRDFVSRNNKLKELGKGVVLILESLWQYSQHPNHIGSSCGGDYSSSQGTWVMAGRLVAHSNRFCLACSYEHAENRTFKA